VDHAGILLFVEVPIAATIGYEIGFPTEDLLQSAFVGDSPVANHGPEIIYEQRNAKKIQHLEDEIVIAVFGPSSFLQEALNLAAMLAL